MTSHLAAAAALPEMPAPRYLDDLAVGDQFTSGEHAMDEGQIKAFAAQFDPQPFHLDEVASRATLFGGLAASGWHTAAVTMRLQVTTGLPIAGGIIGLFIGPVILAVAYQLFWQWVDDQPDSLPAQPRDPA